MKKIIFSLIILSGLLYSCSKSKYEILPKGQAAIATLQSKVGIQKLLIGAYAACDGTINGDAGQAWASTVSNWVWGSIASDDARKGSTIGDQGDINPIEYFYVNSANSYVNSHWRTWYDAVTRANDVLKLLPGTKDMTEAEKTQVEAEAKFLRAHAYFQLTIVHGKVPYIDETAVDPGLVSNDHLVYPEMEKDFAFGGDNLPNRQADKGRVTKWAAKTYLARVLMFEKKFSDAMPILRDIYQNGGYTLMDSYEKNYMIANNNNAESIWEIEYAVNDGFDGSPNANYGDGLAKPLGTAVLGGAGNFFSATHDFVSAFRVDASGLPYLNNTYSINDTVAYSRDGLSVPYKLPLDPRLDHTIGRPGIPFLDYGVVQKGVPIDVWIWNLKDMGPYPLFCKTFFKKSEKAFATTTGWMTGINANNLRVYRLANVILWLAECEVEAGSLHEATLLVNMIRNRSKHSNVVRFDDGTPAANYLCEPYPVDFATKEYARKAVRTEMRLEFGMEGFRFFDLVRWGVASEVLNNYMAVESKIMPPLVGRSFVAGTNEIWPIPLNQLNLTNKGGKTILTQNPNY
ncbi:MAG: RagB/SusD family nutrient uptake outer membrane protein [Ginsengibacter sp.]